MPTVLKEGLYGFFFVSVDYSEPPHIHMRRDDKVAKFWLDPVALQKADRFNPAELNEIASRVSEHRDLLLEKWNEYFGD